MVRFLYVDETPTTLRIIHHFAVLVITFFAIFSQSDKNLSKLLSSDDDKSPVPL